MGKKIKVPKPATCPFCNNPDNSCLIGWGFYEVNNKGCLDWQPSISSVLFIKRFYCKESGKTLSMHPDFLHPRKRYSQAFVGVVLEKVLGSGKGVCETGRDFFLHYQTIQKWIYNLSLGREIKAICFSGYGRSDNFIKYSVWDYAKSFWKLLRKAFKGGPGRVLTAGTRLLWDGYGCSLY